MLQSSLRNKSIASVVFLLGSILAIYFLLAVFYPAFTVANNSHAAEQLQQDQLRQGQASAQSFLNNFQTQTANAAKSNLALPARSTDMVNFTSSLSQLVQASVVTLSDLQINDPVASQQAADNTIQVLDLGVSASGTFASFTDFLSRLDQHLRIIDVYHVTLHTDAAANTGQLQFQIKLRTYYQK